MRFLASAFVGLAIVSGCNGTKSSEQPGDWQSTFGVDKSDLLSSGANPYFVLVPGFRCEYADEDGDEHLTITVLPETETIDGVETRVVEERETKHGKLVEVSRNFMAISSKTKDVYYFGEDVDIHANGRIDRHEGAWRSGVGGAKFGLMIPGSATVGGRYYQEQAPHVAMDRAEIKSTSTRIETPAGTFEHCLEIEESTPLEPHAHDRKVYAPGIGLAVDGDLRLVSHGQVAPGR